MASESCPVCGEEADADVLDPMATSLQVMMT